VLKLRLTKQARRFFDTLPAKQYRQVLNKVLALMDHPEPPDSIQMKGYVYRRADVGEYRIVYHVENDCLNVVAYVGKRNDDDDVYRHLK
jgi:mRNA interferase RelE/StbE